MSSLLRICTAGSVDDGKSTLIGRLLHDSRGVYEDQVQSVRAASRGRTAGPIDFSLFTDGLKAEREQGITIDVAYRYFATARRKFILADTPGHEQYTRNMATGASTADVAVLLVDARHGVREQSRRHARIARLLGITEFVVAVNKIDLVDFDRRVFERVAADFTRLLEDCGGTAVPIPVSALHGDNVITPSARTPWFDGPCLLEHLERVDVIRETTARPFRFPVQLVIRTDDGFRGYAGQIRSGTLRPGDPVTVWPSRRVTRVRRIVTWGRDLDVARAPASVTLVLEDEIDISRGDLLASGSVEVGRVFDADVVWMDERPLDPQRMYLIKHTTRTVPAEVDRGLALNEIGRVRISASLPIVFDRYADDRATGSLIVIDPATNFTAGAGLIVNPVRERDDMKVPVRTAERLAHLARTAASEEEAVTAISRALEEILT
jgi:sulfate adenylyltransferase large subunit